MEHAVVIGGTGMMSGVSCWLGQQGYAVSIVARQPDRLPCATIENMNPIALDYRHTDELRSAIERAEAEHGTITLAVCWIHDSAPHAPDTVANVLNEQGVPVRYVHVLGSASAEPATWQDGKVGTFAQYENISYQRVVLGFVVENPGNQRSRWLTNREISDGVIGVIASNDDVTVVGQIRPWELRP